MFSVERNFSFPFSFSIATEGSNTRMRSEHAAIERQSYSHRGATAFVSESINRVSASTQRNDGKPCGRIASDVLDYWLVLGN